MSQVKNKSTIYYVTRTSPLEDSVVVCICKTYEGACNKQAEYEQKYLDHLIGGYAFEVHGNTFYDE